MEGLYIGVFEEVWKVIVIIFGIVELVVVVYDVGVVVGLVFGGFMVIVDLLVE